MSDTSSEADGADVRLFRVESRIGRAWDATRPRREWLERPPTMYRCALDRRDITRAARVCALPALAFTLRGSSHMGRGRQKAKQTKVARRLKYYSPETNYHALERELGGSSSHTDVATDSRFESNDDDFQDRYNDWNDER